MLLSEINKIVKGNSNINHDIDIHTLLMDSRKIVYAVNAIFICLITARANGHLYIQDAYNKGVRCFLISQDINSAKYPKATFIQVPDTLLSLQHLVAVHRQQFDYPIIGITGSNAKTIIKEWLFQILDGSFQIVRSPKSYNSQLGVALSVWEMTADNNLGIFEAGISMPKEMNCLEKMIRPSIGIITNIGDQHAENFATPQQKIIEKLQLFIHAKILIYCLDHTLIHEQIVNQLEEKILTCQTLTWSKTQAATLQITAIEKQNNQSVCTGIYKNKKIKTTLPFTNDASIENAMHCWLTALHLDLQQDLIQDRMLSLTSVAMRLELKKGINNSTLINDSYNADIGALQIALDFLVEQKQHKKYTLILSDILQSSKSDIFLYEEIAALLIEKNITTLIGIGKAIQHASFLFKQNCNLKSYFYPNTQAFIDNFETHTFQNESILVKGARVFHFEKINALLEEKIHQTVLEINLNAIAQNFNTYRSLLQPNTATMAMVKAFSYGSGCYEVANKLENLGCTYLAVAYATEGIDLRKSGITLPIMVMNPDAAAFDSMIEHNLEPEIYSKVLLQNFIAACAQNEVSNWPIHIKLDTGMHRLGFEENDIAELIQILQHTQKVKVQSVFSHLAASDDATLDKFTEEQAAIFEKLCTQIETNIKTNFYKHLCNTSGIVRHPKLQLNMVRIGIGLYGVDNSGKLKNKIQNVSTLKTTIAQIKNLKTGDTVGYSRKGILSRPSKIGTVCIGYADGISRNLGNGKGSMYINGLLAPIVGNVCMDMCMLDVTDIPFVKEGNEVIIFGAELPINQVAKWAGTIAYEIMTDISQRVKRIYFEE